MPDMRGGTDMNALVAAQNVSARLNGQKVLRDVDLSVAMRLMEHATGDDIRLTLVKGADHRFSDPDCLTLIERSVEKVLARAG